MYYYYNSDDKERDKNEVNNETKENTGKNGTKVFNIIVKEINLYPNK